MNFTKEEVKLKTIFTIGHSTVPINELVSKLKQNKINLLVDVRSKPYSSYNPQFNAPNIRKSLFNAGINYEWRGKNLGGLGKNENYEETIDELVSKCSKINICVMCSEGDPNKCHRKQMLAPSFQKRNVVVNHILWENLKETEVVSRKNEVPENQGSLF